MTATTPKLDTRAADAKISKARTLLMLDCPWFGLLALKLKCECTDKVDTMAVDGTSLFYNPQFTVGLLDLECRSVLAHEVLHCAFKHMYRRLQDHRLDNIAADYVINLVLADSRDKQGRNMFQLPQGGLLDRKYAGMNREQVYRLLEQEQQKGNQSQGQAGLSSDDVKAPPQAGSGQGKQDKQGKAQGAGQGQQPQTGQQGQGQAANGQQQGNGGQLTELDWDIAVVQASKLASSGCPDALRREIEASRTSVDWRQHLRDFMSAHLPMVQSWSRPNRRHIWNQVLPGPKKESVGKLVFAIDTSGSIGPAALNTAWSELMACAEECTPEEIIVLWWDSEVRGVQRFTSDDIPKPVAAGGGGTQFCPVLAWVGKELEEVPACMVVLTDLEFYDRPVDPGYPVLWIVPDWVSSKGSFGETVQCRGM